MKSWNLFQYTGEFLCHFECDLILVGFFFIWQTIVFKKAYRFSLWKAIILCTLLLILACSAFGRPMHLFFSEPMAMNQWSFNTIKLALSMQGLLNKCKISKQILGFLFCEMFCEMFCLYLFLYKANLFIALLVCFFLATLEILMV